LEGKKLQKAYEMSKKTIDAEPQNVTFLDTFGWILYKMDRLQEAKAIFRQVLIYGKDLSAEVLDHYAEVLYALKEYDIAFMYWEQAKLKEKNPKLEKKIAERKTQMK
jgi:tetratricopeptide (TPR) repeat protein